MEDKSVRHRRSDSFETPEMTSASSEEQSPSRDYLLTFMRQQIDLKSDFGLKISAATRK